MKKLIPYLFLLSLTIHMSSQVFIYLGFWVNQDYIAENLCENLDKPQMNCHGVCHLEKELQKDEDRKQHQASQMEIMVYIAPTLNQELKKEKEYPAESKKPSYSEYTFPTTSSFVDSILRPPIA